MQNPFFAVPVSVSVAISLAVSLAFGLQAGPAAAQKDFECLIEPRMVVKLGSQLSGILSDVAVDRSDLVEKGQPVAKLESVIEARNLDIARHRAADRSQVVMSEAAAEYGQAQFARRSELWQGRTISRDTFEQSQTEAKLRALEVERAQNAHELSKLELARAAAMLDLRTIRSPIDGVIVSRLLSPGEYVSEDTPILEIAEIDPLHVSAFIPLGMINQIEVGTQAVVTPEAPLDERIRAPVVVKDRVVDAASGTFGIRLELANPDFKIPAGIRCSLKFEMPD